MSVSIQTRQSRWVGYQGTADYYGGSYTASLTVGNPNILTGEVVLVEDTSHWY